MIDVTDTRKVVSFSYGRQVRGYYASIQAAQPGGRLIEKKNVRNRHHATVSFPLHYSGTCHISVRGSSSGVDEGTIAVK